MFLRTFVKRDTMPNRNQQATLLVFLIAAFVYSGVLARRARYKNQYARRSAGCDNQKETENNVTCPLFPIPQLLDCKEYYEFDDLFKWMNDYISSTVDEKSRPSVTANLVYMDRVVWSGNFGRMSKTNHDRPTQDTIYRIGSIAKVFPVLYLFKLWEEGKVSLHDPITKYAPDFTVDPRMGNADDITLLDVASQIAGLPAVVPHHPLLESRVAFNGTLEDVFRRLRNTVLLATPRSKCIYTNLGYAMLADVLARNFSGGDFERWAQNNIIEALDMKNTGFFRPAKTMSDMATGYLFNGWPAPFFDLMWYGPAGNYFSSAADLAKFSMSFLETSKTMLTHQSLTEMLRTRKLCQKGYLGGRAHFTGSPWEMNLISDYLVASKDGDMFGYSSSMALVPDLKLAFNILMSGNRGENVARKVLQKAIPVFRTVLRSVERKGKPVYDPWKYVGNFTFYGTENVTITDSGNGRLEMSKFNLQLNAPYVTALDYVKDGLVRAYIKDNGYPCNAVTNMMNGALLQFKDFRGGRYHEFDILDLYFFGFKRI